jgi:hypothetical protein
VALGEAAFLELVEEEHQPAGRRAELAGQGLLALPGLPGNQAQEAGLSRGQVQRGDAPGPARCGFSAELGEQERVPAAPSHPRATGPVIVMYGLTVLIVAEAYVAVIAGLVIAAGGPARAGDLLAVRRPGARQLAWSLTVLLAAVAASLAVSLAFSPRRSPSPDRRDAPGGRDGARADPSAS